MLFLKEVELVLLCSKFWCMAWLVGWEKSLMLLCLEMMGPSGNEEETFRLFSLKFRKLLEKVVVFRYLAVSEC